MNNDRAIPLTPSGALWSQREYVAAMGIGIGFAGIEPGAGASAAIAARGGGVRAYGLHPSVRPHRAGDGTGSDLVNLLQRIRRLFGSRPIYVRTDLRLVPYAEADKMLRANDGWRIAREEDDNRAIGLVFLERVPEGEAS